ncbi:SAM-dependent methyltransferase [Dactylosporangium sp. NPDC049742]|uniref:SAM-dependent methyltransferase n=1 Tax=Dactylosporangium sp. NPDC049742 TaxID=3154737 RepID=UPI0034451DCE
MPVLPEWVPDGVDITTPNAARVYDHALGGFHNFEVDRRFAEDAERAWPGVIQLAHDNRAFLGRVVRWLAGNGIRQFLDIGSGIPTLGNVHEVAQYAAADARVVYVDIDPVAVAHSQRILAGNRHATAVQGDLRRPQDILGHPAVTDLLDFSRPIGVLMVAVLHFIGDPDDPARILREFADATVAGSYVAVSHSVPAEDAAGQENVRRLYQRTPTSLHVRTPAEVAGLLAGWQVEDPGLVPISDWRPDPEDADDPAQRSAFGGVARKLGTN